MEFLSLTRYPTERNILLLLLFGSRGRVFIGFIGFNKKEGQRDVWAPLRPGKSSRCSG